MKHHILMIDDDEDNLISTAFLLKRWGYEVLAAKSGDEGITKLREGVEEFSIILLDYKMPEKNGAETAIELRKINSDAVILIYSCDESREAVISSMRAGAINFIEKNDDLLYLKEQIEAATHHYETKTRTLKKVNANSDPAKLLASVGMIGISQKMVSVAESILVFRNSKKNILIRGETGSGKELVAKALHTEGNNRFFAVNCASFGNNSQLLESELFGYEKGAFTGAINRKVGIFEAARGGTVFLDEVHHMSLQSQAQLLRVIRERKIRRLGAVREEDVDFRLIVATKPEIEEWVKEGKFLPDLYYRFKFLCIDVPSLRERLEDIAPLVMHFCEKHFQETGEKKTFLMHTIRALEQYNWPGNVGELEGYITALLERVPSDTISSHHLDPEMFHAQSRLASFAALEERQEREKRRFLTESLKTSKSMQQAAERIGLPRQTFQSMLSRFKVNTNIEKS